MSDTKRPTNPLVEEILNLYFPVLDHGFVSICDYMGGDQEIESAARVSYGAGTRKTNQTKGLIRYLKRHAHCYTPEMEVLTIRGWIRWDQCNEYETFLVPNTINKSFTLETLKVEEFDYNDEVYSFNNNRMSYNVTKDHTMWFKKRKFWKNITPSLFEKVKIQNMGTSGHFEPSGNYFLFNKNGYCCPKMQFIAFYLGDGHYHSKNKIKFHFKKNRKKEYLEKLCNILNIDYKKTQSEAHKNGNVYSMCIPDFLINFLEEHIEARSKEKQFNINKIKLLNDNEIRGLFDGLINSDGCIKKDRPQIEFGVTSYNLSKIFELLSTLLGIDSHFTDAKIIKSFPGKRITLEARKQYFNKKKYNGKVYCTTTSTGLLAVRGDQTKFGFICGNSTPSEMVELKFHICCPIFIMRQWIRHRMSSTNEYSGRYSLMPMMFYTPEKENFALQSKNNNQGRAEVANETFYKETVEKWNKLREQNADLYENLTEADLARELARIDLPLSTYTQFYWKINLHNLFHFLKLRVDSHAQFEIQEYGKIIAGMVKRVAPLSYEAWMDYDVLGIHLSRMELNAIKNFINIESTQDGKKYIDTSNYSSPIFEDDASIGSVREFNELINKFSRNNDIPNFDLDLSKAKNGLYFEEKMLAAVPKIDKK